MYFSFENKNENLQALRLLACGTCFEPYGPLINFYLSLLVSDPAAVH